MRWRSRVADFQGATGYFPVQGRAKRMQRTTKTATLSRFKTQLRAAVVGVGVLFTSTPTMVAGDGVYRSLSSGDVTYANPIDLGISSSYSDQATQASGIQVMDGMYISTSAEPGPAYPAIPSPTQGVAVDQPMVFHGTPVLHNSLPATPAVHSRQLLHGLRSPVLRELRRGLVQAKW